MAVERAPAGTSLIDVLDRVLDKGIVIDAYVRVSLVGIDLVTVEARIVVASVDTYLKYSEAIGITGIAARPMVASGAGVALAPDLGLTRLNPGVVARPLAFGPKRRVLAAYRDGEDGSLGIPDMVLALREAVAAREPLFPAAAGAS